MGLFDDGSEASLPVDQLAGDTPLLPTPGADTGIPPWALGRTDEAPGPAFPSDFSPFDSGASFGAAPQSLYGALMGQADASNRWADPANQVFDVSPTPDPGLDPNVRLAQFAVTMPPPPPGVAMPGGQRDQYGTTANDRALGNAIWNYLFGPTHYNSEQAPADASTSPPAASPEITPDDLKDKTEEEIEQLAKEKGLVPHPTKPQKYMDPVTGKERLRIDPGHVTKSGEPFDKERARVPHAHGYDKTGKVKIRDPIADDPHFPLRPGR